ncbi:MAG TPA: hypothetical protein VI299_11850 [Polyangiales bacterium]
MASHREAADRPSKSNAAPTTPMQRLLQGAGIPMPVPMHWRAEGEELALFTAEERSELKRGNAEQCEANR